MTTQDVSLFSLSREGQLGDILVPFEYVLSVTTRASTLFALTSNGRILTLNEEFKVTGEAKLPPQKKQVSDYARIDYVDISGVLIVLFNNVLYFFRIEDKSADVQRLLVCPDDQREKVVWKWRADSIVSSISFDGFIVCLTTQTGCFVHPFGDSTSDPILAFPIDRAVLPLNGSPPSICHVNNGNFVVTGCMPDMALFVDGRGSAARPPLIWNHEHPRSIVKTEDSLVVIGETKLFVFDNFSAGRMRQSLDLPSHPCASGLLADSVVIFTRSADADVFCIRQLSWSQKANDLLDKGELESALYVVRNNEIKSDEDLITYQQVHLRVGFEKISKKEEEEGISLLLEGHVSPFDVNTHFTAIFDKIDSPADQISDVILVEKLISEVLEKPWSEDQTKDWATLLTIARMRLIESPIDLIEVLGNREGYDEQSVNDYVDGRKLVNAQLVLRTVSHPLSEVLTLDWLDASLHPLVDRVLLVTLMNGIDSSGIEIVRKWTDYLKENNESEELLLELVQKRATWFDDQFVLYLFKGRTNELEVLLSLYLSDQHTRADLKCRLVQLVIDRLSPTHEELPADENARLRKLLIEIILSEKEAHVEELLTGNHLTVERVVAANRADPEKAIQGVIESVEFPGALQAIQQIIHHFSSSNSSLSTHFLHQLKRKCECDPSAAASLRLPEVMRTVIEASPSLIKSGAIKYIPDNSALDTFAPLIFRELQSVNDGSVASRIKKAFSEKARESLVDPSSKSSFRVTDSSRCGVCSKRFDPLNAIHYLPSGKIVHSSCHPHVNICPMTNQIFRA
ncbi:hypothetical protein PRIPAC_95915 [Pristionchus pacificus]|uniref:Vps39_2 domain-containing protein n=1 Tax=Pristionchus pacificus TaxID=54126 RepID=A0A2A6BCF6_PRIPA|nr:hypothetical protein PRIPAC_95915 [Pristionchus pacificus]|eukprot:PDM63569.1 hypothetical protein PRIPAC_49542 [Pristionchus pacificus]